jgi:ABC-type multidrug transport system ATPase subunit
MKIEEILDQQDFLKNILDLELHSNKIAATLSGGNKRKLCSAMALMSKPDLIFMDEVSNGVDPISRKRLYTYLRSLP